jgi:phospholipid/cholesterol/gamma-HCH transport system substrate-binding protein
VQFICGGSFDAAAGLSGPEYWKRAEICRERLAPPLRRLTFNYPPMMFHPLNSITAYKGQVIYDTPATQAKAQTPIPDLKWIPAPGVHAPSAADLQAMLVPPAPAKGTAPPGGPTPLPAEQGGGR